VKQKIERDPKIKLNLIVSQMMSRVTYQAMKLLRRHHSRLSVENLLSEENKKRTLESFKKMTRLRYGKKPPSRHAAILVPICISADNEISVLYTLRSSKLRTHKGQIAFPGKRKLFFWLAFTLDVST
jgi:hypothetical protein